MGVFFRKDENDEYEISIGAMLKALWRRKWIILALTVITALAVYGYKRLTVEYSYTSSFSAYVNDTTALSKVAAVADWEPLMEQAAEDMGVERSKLGSVYVSSNAAAYTITVYVTASTAEQAYDTASELAELLEPYAREMMGLTTEIKSTGKPVKATAANAVSFKKPAAFMAGVVFILSCILVLIIDCIRNVVCTPEELETYYGIPVIGRISCASSEVNNAHTETENREEA